MPGTIMESGQAFRPEMWVAERISVSSGPSIEMLLLINHPIIIHN
jgi:hypothetical protein